MNRDKLWEMMDNKIPNYLLKTILDYIVLKTDNICVVAKNK
jgi:hypothetical protein